MACTKAVRSALESVEGVTKAKVSMPNKALVSYIGENVAATDLAPKLLEAVKAAGYGATLN